MIYNQENNTGGIQGTANTTTTSRYTLPIYNIIITLLCIGIVIGTLAYIKTDTKRQLLERQSITAEQTLDCYLKN